MHQYFSLEEYYLLKKREVGTNFPWKRFLNYEYLEHENNRLHKLYEWLKDFKKAPKNQSVDEVSLYVIPLEISSSWEASIARLVDFDFIGLSAFQNSPPVVVVGLLPRIVKCPDDYKLIRIMKSRKYYLRNEKLKINEPVLVIEDWEYLPSDSIYLDIPYEKRIIQKLLKENLVPNDNVSLAFQSPILSAPFVFGSVGGISLSSMSGDSSFGYELVKTIYQTVPPEYRPFAPPIKVYAGNKFEYLEGIKFHLAERPYSDRNFLSGVPGRDYSILQSECIKRSRFNGEYSIFSTLSPNEGNVTQIWKELMKNFASTDVTLPMDLDELSHITDLTRMRKEINSDLWVQIVHARQICPPLNEKATGFMVETVNKLKEDFDMLLSDVYKNDLERKNLVDYMIHPTQFNVKRLVQSIARSENRSELIKEDFSRIRSLLLDNFTGFIDHPRFERIRMQMETKKSDLRYSVIESALINNPRLTISEVYDSVKSTNLFRDIYDLQKLLDWLHERGHLIISADKRYIWIGPKSN